MVDELNELWGARGVKIAVHRGCAGVEEAERWGRIRRIGERPRKLERLRLETAALSSGCGEEEKGERDMSAERGDELGMRIMNDGYIKGEKTERIWVRMADLGKISLPADSEKKTRIDKWLSKEEREDFQEEKVVLMEKELWEESAKIKMKNGLEKSAYEELAKRMEEKGMIRWEEDESKIRIVNTLHCVPKGREKLRLIFDARRANKVMKLPPKIDLPALDLVREWYMGKEEIAQFGKLDLDNYYYRLVIPEWMGPFLALPPIIQRETNKEERKRWPIFTVLPMGVSWAVYLAQKVHLGILSTTSWGAEINVRVTGQQKRWILVYIDDVVIARKGRGEEEKGEVNAMLEEAIAKYKEAGLVINPDKVEKATEKIQALGCILEGREARIMPVEDKLWKLEMRTEQLRRRGWSSTRELQVEIGKWIWWMLLRRETLVILFHTYRWVNKVDLREWDKRRQLWETVRDELAQLQFASRWLKIQWRREYSGEIIATDASNIAGGAVIRRLGSEVWEEWFHKVWERQEHINVLEARALMKAVGQSGAERWADKRVEVWLDSQALVGAIKKGRSSSYDMYRQLRKWLAVSCVQNWEVQVKWVASEHNPADGISRRGKEGRGQEDLGGVARENGETILEGVTEIERQ